MEKRVIYGALSALISVSTYADFQYELVGGYIDFDSESVFAADPIEDSFFGGIAVDFNPDRELDSDFSAFVVPPFPVTADSILTVEVDDDGFFAGGSLYFETVDTSKGPLSEAVFLSKSSNISVGYSDIGGLDTTAVAGRFVVGNDFVVQAGYSDSDFDSTFSAGLGKYLTDTSEILLSYTASDDSDIDTLGLSYRGISDLGGNSSLGYGVGAEYVDVPSDSGNGFNGGLTYYGAPEWGVGVSASFGSIGDFDTTIYGVGGEYFFFESFALSMEFLRIESESEFGPISLSEDIDQFLLEALFRF